MSAQILSGLETMVKRSSHFMYSIFPQRENGMIEAVVQL